MQIGKDRTGLIAALILAACGATDDEIVSDYARSDSPDGIALGGLEKLKELEGGAPSYSQRLQVTPRCYACVPGKRVDFTRFPAMHRIGS